jgi:hypothetical protein
VIGRVRLKPGREQEALAMISERGVAMLQEMAGSADGYWARPLAQGELIQHSFWLFDTERNAHSAEAAFNTLRNLPDAPAQFVSVDVCEVVGRALRPSAADTEPGQNDG